MRLGLQALSRKLIRPAIRGAAKGGTSGNRRASEITRGRSRGRAIVNRASSFLNSILGWKSFACLATIKTIP